MDETKAVYVSRKSNYLIDFSRIANLIFSNHNYSNKELFDRCFIILSTVASGYLAYKYDNKNDGQSKTIVKTLAGLFLGFCISHSFVIAPLIYKRKKIQDQCTVIINDLKDSLKSNDDLSETFKKDVYRIINEIYNLNFSTNTKANSSLTWGKRLKLLNSLQEVVQYCIWNFSVDSIFLSDDYEIKINIDKKSLRKINY